MCVLLKDKVRKNGFDYKLVKRGKVASIYEQVLSEDTNAYEVFKRKIAKPQTIYGQDYPAREQFPCNEDIGTIGKTCSTLDKALMHFDRYESTTDSNGSDETPIVKPPVDESGQYLLFK